METQLADEWKQIYIKGSMETVRYQMTGSHRFI